MLLWTCGKSLKLASHSSSTLLPTVTFCCSSCPLSALVHGAASCVRGIVTWRQYSLCSELHSAVFNSPPLFDNFHLCVIGNLLSNLCVTCYFANNKKWFAFPVPVVTCSSKWQFAGWNELFYPQEYLDILGGKRLAVGQKATQKSKLFQILCEFLHL